MGSHSRNQCRKNYLKIVSFDLSYRGVPFALKLIFYALKIISIIKIFIIKLILALVKKYNYDRLNYNCKYNCNCSCNCKDYSDVRIEALTVSKTFYYSADGGVGSGVATAVSLFVGDTNRTDNIIQIDCCKIAVFGWLASRGWSS